jgi:transcriptional regulator with XRE-family HTH domain
MPNVSNEIGFRIKKLREERDIKQQDLAEALHVQRVTVSQWENGTRDLKTEYTIKLADYFGVTCDEILRGIKSENVDISRELGLTDKAIDVLKLQNQLGHSDLTQTINFLLEELESTLMTSLGFTAYDENDLPTKGFGNEIITKIMYYFNIKQYPEEKEMLISQSGKFIDDDPLKNKSFEDIISICSIGRNEIIEKVLFDNICNAIKESKLTYTTEYKIQQNYDLSPKQSIFTQEECETTFGGDVPF